MGFGLLLTSLSSVGLDPAGANNYKRFGNIKETHENKNQ